MKALSEAEFTKVILEPFPDCQSALLLLSQISIGSRWLDVTTEDVYEWDGNEWINLSEKENGE